MAFNSMPAFGQQKSAGGTDQAGTVISPINPGPEPGRNPCMTCDAFPLSEVHWNLKNDHVFLCGPRGGYRFGFNVNNNNTLGTGPVLPARYSFRVYGGISEDDEALTVINDNELGLCNGISLMPGTANDSRIGTTSSQSLHLGADRQFDVTIVPGGNVGIGTQTPQAKLHVDGHTKVNQTLEVDGQITGNQNATFKGNLEVGTGENNVNGQMKARLLQLFKVDGTANDGYLDIGRSNSHWQLTQRNNVGDEFQILKNTNGSFGSPILKLTPSGSAIFGHNNATVTHRYEFKTNSTFLTNAFKVGNETNTMEFNHYGAGTPNYNELNFRIQAGSGLEETQFKLNGNTFLTAKVGGITKLGNGNQLICAPNGNVGIGTGSPQAELHVSGDAYLTGNLGIGISTPTTKLEVGGNGRITGNLKLEGLSGTGSRMVVTDATGNLSAIAIPSSTGDNLGNHVATQGLNLNANAISNSATLSFAGGGSLQPMGNNELRLNGRLDIGGANSQNFEPFQVNGNSRILNGGLKVGSPQGSFGAQNGEISLEGNGFKPGGGPWGTNSDLRLKENIEPFKDGLSQLSKIKPVSYNFKRGVVQNHEKRYIGIIAQEIKEILPYTVEKRRNKFAGIDEGDYYTFDGSALTYVIINSIKELKLEIDSLKKIISSKENSTTTAGAVIQPLKQGLELLQNIPNPSDNSTRIDFKIPDGFNKAYLSIYDLNGKEIKRIEINHSGNGFETLYRKDFGTGVFIYTLYANGLVPVSKSLIFN